MAKKLSKGGLIGVDKVMKNLNLQLKKIRLKTLPGMLAAAAIVRRDMDITPPLIPLDTGNLRASWFTTSTNVGGNPIVTMGFNASYALIVHEKHWKHGKRPGSGPKFFEASLNRNKEKMLAAIAGTVRI